MREIQKLLSALLLSVLLLGNTAAFAAGSAPVAENLELRTYRNVSVGGRLSAFDAEDDVVSFSITTEPVKGSIELEENGCFVYTPKENRRGRDYFGYKAVDSEGNLSQEATVIIRIEKQKKAVVYSDLEGQACAAAAVTLSEQGIFTGEYLGGMYCFQQERPVSRGEYLAMCVKLLGQKPLRSAARSGYSDDASIPAWVRSCAAAARLRGAAPVCDALRAEEPVSCEEAAVWLSRLLHLQDVRYGPDDAALSQAVRNLRAHGIPAATGSRILTRAEAAEMLAAAAARQQ